MYNFGTIRLMSKLCETYVKNKIIDNFNSLSFKYIMEMKCLCQKVQGRCEASVAAYDSTQCIRDSTGTRCSVIFVQTTLVVLVAAACVTLASRHKDTTQTQDVEEYKTSR